MLDRDALLLALISLLTASASLGAPACLLARWCCPTSDPEVCQSSLRGDSSTCSPASHVSSLTLLSAVQTSERENRPSQSALLSLSLSLSVSLSLSLSVSLSLCLSLSLHQQSDHCLPLRTKSWKISCGATLFHYITNETPNCCRVPELVPEMSCVQNMVSSKPLSPSLSVSTFMWGSLLFVMVARSKTFCWTRGRAWMCRLKPVD